MENVRKAIVRMVKGLKSFLTELDIQVNLKMTEEMDGNIYIFRRRQLHG